mmetsp:Transcript_27738/g.66830  ORF Transcript_27738/g.66830 Transcript_27738/m.66830 type:complete len:119 (-) Transcript_27738:836-1192(-)
MSRSRQVKHKLSQLGKKLPCSLPAPPEPTNKETKTYGVGEFIEIVSKYPKGSRLRGGMIKHILAEGYVKRNQDTLRKVLKNHEQKGKDYAFDEEWNFVGRKPLLNDTDGALQRLPKGR